MQWVTVVLLVAEEVSAPWESGDQTCRHLGLPHVQASSYRPKRFGPVPDWASTDVISSLNFEAEAPATLKIWVK